MQNFPPFVSIINPMHNHSHLFTFFQHTKKEFSHNKKKRQRCQLSVFHCEGELVHEKFIETSYLTLCKK